MSRPNPAMVLVAILTLGLVLLAAAAKADPCKLELNQLETNPVEIAGNALDAETVEPQTEEKAEDKAG